MNMHIILDIDFTIVVFSQRSSGTVKVTAFWPISWDSGCRWKFKGWPTKLQKEDSNENDKDGHCDDNANMLLRDKKAIDWQTGIPIIPLCESLFLQAEAFLVLEFVTSASHWVMIFSQLHSMWFCIQPNLFTQTDSLHMNLSCIASSSPDGKSPSIMAKRE